MTFKRIVYPFFLASLILLAPYWIYLPALLFGIVVFPFFWEGIILGLLIDTVYGPWASLGQFPFFPIGLSVVVLLFIRPFIKRRLRFNA